MRRLEPLLVLLGYTAGSLLLIGRFLLRAPDDAVVGSFGGDQSFFAWSLVHWLEVLRWNQTPFMTDRIDAPVGFNLAWATTIPGPAVLMAPVTALAGPLVTYNTLALAAPALVAWTMYLLCRHITRDALASIIGGWAFGFSSYILGETLNHLNLALVAALPLIVLVVVRLIEGSLPRWWGTIALGALIAIQFLIFTEVAATATLVGVIALVAALVLGPSDLRLRIVRALPSIGAAYCLALLVVSPLLVAAFLHPNPLVGVIRPNLYPLDLQNLMVPTVVTWVGGAWFREESLQFAGNLTEQLGYIGPLLVLVALAGLWRWRRERFAWVITIASGAAVVLAFGARLTIAGEASLWLPWDAVARLPLIGLALPTRIVVFAWLGVALLTALFVMQRPGGLRRASATRGLITVLALVFLLPVPSAGRWRTGLDTPPGIALGTATAEIPNNAVVLILPYAFRGNGMYWQALAGQRYRQAGGYSAATIPQAYARFPIVEAFYSDRLPPDADQELLRFLAYTGTTWVLIDARTPGPWTKLLREAGGRRDEVGGVIRFHFETAGRAQIEGT